MIKNVLTVLSLIALLSCQSNASEEEKNSSISSQKTSEPTETVEKVEKIETATDQKETNLKDSISVKGNTIVVLKPDSLRFQYYVDKGIERIYEVDSDFAFNVDKAFDSLAMNKVSKKISDKRYIKITDCKNCPITIDRDTIDYGIIMTGFDKELKFDQNIYGKEYYMDLFLDFYK